MTEQAPKPIILIICNYYLPGFEGGGSIRTLANLVERLGVSYDFRIITRDRDMKIGLPYDSVKIGDWNRIGRANVYYLFPGQVSSGVLKRLIGEVAPHAIYVNSFFSPLTIITLMLRKFGRIPKIPIILSPDGELTEGSLSIKPLKKRLYMLASKLLNLQGDVIWKAAAELEHSEIEQFAGNKATVMLSSCLPPRMILDDFDQSMKQGKRAGHAKMVFVSRFMRKKNLNWLLEQIESVRGELEIDIYGPIEEPDYWQETAKIIETLPENIKVAAKGAIAHNEVAKTMAKYHFFVLPTLSENFGHVFLEALAAGCPLVISDQTPWRQLEEKGIGWDTPLAAPEEWAEVIDKCLSMNGEDYREMSQQARTFAVNWLADSALEQSNRDVLQAAISRNAVR